MNLIVETLQYKNDLSKTKFLTNFIVCVCEHPHFTLHYIPIMIQGRIFACKSIAHFLQLGRGDLLSFPILNLHTIIGEVDCKGG